MRAQRLLVNCQPSEQVQRVVLLFFPQGIITSLLPALRMHRGSGLLFLMNFKAPLAAEITFLWVYLFIDLLPSKAKGEKEARQKGRREGDEELGGGGRPGR